MSYEQGSYVPQDRALVHMYAIDFEILDRQTYIEASRYFCMLGQSL